MSEAPGQPANNRTRLPLNIPKAISTRPTGSLRRVVQFGVAAMFLIAAFQFGLFVEALKSGAPLPYRPPMVEGFLPIAAIVALVAGITREVFDMVHPAGLVILLAAMFTALLFRRALCGWLCPIGLLSEMLGKVGRRARVRGMRKSLGAHKLPRSIDWPLLALKLALFVYIFDMFFLMEGSQAFAFMRSPYYAVSDVKMFEFFGRISLIGLSVIAALAILTFFIKSFWCRYLCPYGSLLGVLGLFSPMVLKRDDDACIHCGKCSRVCPNSVTVDKGPKVILSTECMGCATCVEECPAKEKGALQFRALGFFRIKPLVYAALFLAVFFGAITTAKLTGHWETVLNDQQYRIFYQRMK